jgi:hypothetical protein
MKVTFKHKITEERLRDYITRDCEDWDHKEMNHYKNTPLADQLKELEMIPIYYLENDIDDDEFWEIGERDYDSAYVSGIEIELIK